MRMDGQNVDLVETETLFNLDDVKKLSQQGQAAMEEVDLDKVEKEDLGIESDEDPDDAWLRDKLATSVEKGKAKVIYRRGAGAFDLPEFAELDENDADEDYVRALEEELDQQYKVYLEHKKKKSSTPVEVDGNLYCICIFPFSYSFSFPFIPSILFFPIFLPVVPAHIFRTWCSINALFVQMGGKTMTRKQRLAVEAKATEEAALKRLDRTHQKYLNLLASASKVRQS